MTEPVQSKFTIGNVVERENKDNAWQPGIDCDCGDANGVHSQKVVVNDWNLARGVALRDHIFRLLEKNAFTWMN